jgi:ADP-heptose:LPS heptosyltransferase
VINLRVAAALELLGGADVREAVQAAVSSAAPFATAQLVISGDTGIAHLASAYQTPSVILFGPTSPEQWDPPAQGPFTVIWRGVTGDPHSRWVHPALLEIGSDEVLAAAEARLGVRGPQSATPRISR